VASSLETALFPKSWRRRGLRGGVPAPPGQRALFLAQRQTGRRESRNQVTFSENGAPTREDCAAPPTGALSSSGAAALWTAWHTVPAYCRRHPLPRSGCRGRQQPRALLGGAPEARAGRALRGGHGGTWQAQRHGRRRSWLRGRQRDALKTKKAEMGTGTLCLL